MTDHVGCCGQAGPEEVVVRVKVDHWKELGRCLENWLDINQKIEAAGDAAWQDDEMAGSEFEIRGELADAAERLVRSAKIDADDV